MRVILDHVEVTRQGRREAPPGAELAAEGVGCARSSIRDGWAQQEFPNLNHVARGLVLGETPLEGVGRTLR